MSSVTYAENGETKDPKTLVGYVDNKKFMEKIVQPGDMLFNNKTQDLIIMTRADDWLYYANAKEHVFMFDTASVHKDDTRFKTQKKIPELKDYEYIPVEQIKNLNFDIEMK